MRLTWAFQNQGFTFVASLGSPKQSGQPAIQFAIGCRLDRELREHALAGGNDRFSAPVRLRWTILSAGSTVTSASGLASVMATANSIAGTFVVTASATGGTPIALFNLTNQITPTFSGLNGQTVTYGSTLTLTGTLEAGVQVPVGGEVAVTVMLHARCCNCLGRSFSAQIARSDVVLNAAATAYTVAYDYVAMEFFCAAMGSSRLTVNPLALTVTAVANTKAYDGTTAQRRSRRSPQEVWPRVTLPTLSRRTTPRMSVPG